MIKQTNLLRKIWRVLVALFILTFDVIICSSVGTVVYMGAGSNGVNRIIALMIAIVLSIIVYLYLIFNFRLRNFINRSLNQDE